MNVNDAFPVWPALRNRIADSVPGVPRYSVGNHLGRLATELLNVRPEIDPSCSPHDRTQGLAQGPSPLLLSTVSSHNIDLVVDQLRSVSQRYALLGEVGKPPFYPVHRLPEFCTEYALALTAAKHAVRSLNRVYSLYGADQVRTQNAVNRIVQAAALDDVPNNVITAIENGHVFRHAPTSENDGGEMVNPASLALNKNWDMLFAQFPDPISVSSVAPMTEAQYRQLHDA